MQSIETMENLTASYLSLYSSLSVEWYYCLPNATLCGALGAPHYLTQPYPGSLEPAEPPHFMS